MQLLIQQAVFTEFRTVFIAMIVILAIFLILSLIPQGDSPITYAMVLVVSIVQFILGSLLFYTESELIQQLELTADSLTLYLFIAIVILSVANPVIYYFRNRKRPSSRYRYKRY